MKKHLGMLLCLLLLSALLIGCGKPASSPPPAASAPPAAPTEAPAVPAAAPAAEEDGLAFTGADGALRALLRLGGLRSERAGQITLRYRLRNASALPLTRVRFTLDALDADGRLLNRTAVPVTLGFLDQPLMPGEEREIERTHYFTDAEKTASVQLTPAAAENTEELPAWTEPRPNNLLPDFCNNERLLARFQSLDTELPVALIYAQDEEGERTITDPEVIRAAAEALMQVRIGSETGKNVDDGGFSYTFVMADGSQWGFRFDFRDLLYWQERNYEVLDAEALFQVELDPED